MIAHVRIAPVQKWCDFTRRGLLKGREVAEGDRIGIETTSMRLSACGGKGWLVVSVPEDVEMFDCRTGKEMDGAFMCEHMLEMD